MKYKVKKWKIEINENLIKVSKEKIRKDLRRYFQGKPIEFDYVIDLSEFTEFQKKVLEAMRKVPYGKTISYQKLAKRVGNENAQRAVGNVCSINPLPIIIPCHRVVGKNNLGGYGLGLDLKKYLIELEKNKR